MYYIYHTHDIVHVCIYILYYTYISRDINTTVELEVTVSGDDLVAGRKLIAVL